MTPPRKVPHPETASLSKWRCFLSECHWGGDQRDDEHSPSDANQKSARSGPTLFAGSCSWYQSQPSFDNSSAQPCLDRKGPNTMLLQINNMIYYIIYVIFKCRALAFSRHLRCRVFSRRHCAEFFPRRRVQHTYRRRVGSLGQLFEVNENNSYSWVSTGQGCPSTPWLWPVRQGTEGGKAAIRCRRGAGNGPGSVPARDGLRAPNPAPAPSSPPAPSRPGPAFSPGRAESGV